MAEETPPCNIRIDREGTWFYQGRPIVNKKIYHHLNRCLERDRDGRYLLKMEGEQCYLEVEDTPFVVREVAERRGPGGKPFLAVIINDGTEEALMPETLRTGRDNVLYCSIKSGKFDARFLRPAYYQMGKHLEQDGAGYCLVVGDGRTPIKQL